MHDRLKLNAHTKIRHLIAEIRILVKYE